MDATVAASGACAAALVVLAACSDGTEPPDPEGPAAIRVAHLGRDGGDPDGLAALRADFEARNPGYGVDWRSDATGLAADDRPAVAFVQAGTASGSVRRADGTVATSDPALAVGDVVLLRPTERLEADAPLSAVVFTVPEPLPDDLPTFVRPDWDERITDTPGGCAEEGDAYRRILLTWLDSVGPYVYRALNCHRVRIADSFAHYHPLEGGFDEIYLVQGAPEGSVLYTSTATRRIEDPASVSADDAARLIERRELSVGDLVYLPRGTVHRGFGGVLAQVITAPGFRPGAEIGVDHHLRAINERLGLEGERALPFRVASSSEAVVK